MDGPSSEKNDHFGIPMGTETRVEGIYRQEKKGE